MATIHDILRTRLLTNAGVLEAPVTSGPSLRELRKSEWSPEFERLMRNRLIMGFYRYELFAVKRKSFPR